VQYLSILALLIFLIWLSLVKIIYRNDQCAKLQTEKFQFRSNLNHSYVSSLIDPRLKLNHFAVVGTHNSYHLANSINKYDHINIDEQFSSGIRQIELDIHLMKDNFLIYHLQLFDDRTNCYCLLQCLDVIRQWMGNHRSHHPVYLFFEIKQMFYEDLLTGLSSGVQCEHFQQLKDQIDRIFPAEVFVNPLEVQGDQPSIQAALEKQRRDELSGDYTQHSYGWPTLLRSLGKLIPVFLDDVHQVSTRLYSQCASLRDFFFIAQSNPSHSYSSIITLSNVSHYFSLAQQILQQGQISRYLLSFGNNRLLETYQQINKYSIHIISTDFFQCTETDFCQALLHDYQSSPVACHSTSAPTFCSTSALTVL
jgi:Phosphoinositide phospholipase C, Ca2+-dependent